MGFGTRSLATCLAMTTPLLVVGGIQKILVQPFTCMKFYWCIKIYSSKGNGFIFQEFEKYGKKEHKINIIEWLTLSSIGALIKANKNIQSDLEGFLMKIEWRKRKT
jgi:hypothetical protein